MWAAVLVAALECQGMQCVAREGVVEFSGRRAELAGFSLRLEVVEGAARSVRLERDVAVASGGRFSAAFAVAELPEGNYAFGLLAPGRKRIATGSFRIGAAREPSIAGHWHGVAGTAADVRIDADGTYVFGGAVKGTWRRLGGEILFTGPLSAWNGGRGKLNSRSDVIEFFWTGPRDRRNYFAIAKD